MVQSLNTPDVIVQPIAENGDKNTIPPTNDGTTGAMSQSVGFPPITSQRISEGGKAVRRADMNGALNLISQPQYFAQLGGTYTFRQDVSDAVGGYPLGAKLWYTDSNTGEVSILESLKANNTANFNTNPDYVNDGVNWKFSLPTQTFLNSNYVTLNTDQTIRGQKNFILKGSENSKGMIFINENITSAVPSSDQYTALFFQGADGSNTGYIQTHKLANGYSITTMHVDNGRGANQSIHIGLRETGAVYTVCPACGDPSSILTTLSRNLSQNGYVRLGNGLIIQWGSVTSTGTYNWPTPFSSSNSYSMGFSSVIYPNQTATGMRIDDFNIGTSYKPPQVFFVAIGY